MGMVRATPREGQLRSGTQGPGCKVSNGEGGKENRGSPGLRFCFVMGVAAVIFTNRFRFLDK